MYNQNYKGLYCTCHRVYPDPEGEALGEMLQCCICEDWFHELHLGLPSTLQVRPMRIAFSFLLCRHILPMFLPEFFLQKNTSVVSWLNRLSCLLQFPRDDEGEPIFDELICKSCVPKCSFLSKYYGFVIAPSAAPDVSADPVEIVDRANGAGKNSPTFLIG